jgi:urease gamma subunit
MPLSAQGAALIRANLEQIEARQRVRLVEIGVLTTKQLSDINRHRAARGLTMVSAEVVFIGKHIYQSRIAKDGYTIEDVIDQIANAMHADSVVLDISRMTAIEKREPREDRYGNKVRDRAVFECTTHHPRPELFSVIPKGDLNKP